MANYLILIRHGESEWNKLGLWTGWTDVNLAEAGTQEARRAGETLRELEHGAITIDAAHVSALKRAQQTLAHAAEALGQTFPIAVSAALNERDYGEYTGKNKWEVKEKIGDEAFERLRRGWDVAVPGGETLKMVHDRVVPYYQGVILEQLKNGKTVLVAAHGNSLRALMKHIEQVPDDHIHKVEIGTGEVVVYEVKDGELHRTEKKATV